MTKQSPEALGFERDVLPEQLITLIEDLEAQAGDPHTGASKRKKASKSPYRTEAEHYWGEVFTLEFQVSHDVVAHAMRAFRERFREELADLD